MDLKNKSFDSLAKDIKPLQENQKEVYQLFDHILCKTHQQNIKFQ